MGKTRAIRFSKEEDQRIGVFLKRNPFFDFSTLAKTAIDRFIENPELTLKAVKADKRPLRKREINVEL